MPRKPKDPIAGMDLLAVLKRHPAALKALHEHGVHFCAGCYLTLSATPEKAAAYHAVSDLKAFLADLRAAARRSR